MENVQEYDTGLYYQNGNCIFGGCSNGFQDNGFGECQLNCVKRSMSPTFKQNGVFVLSCGNDFSRTAIQELVMPKRKLVKICLSVIIV